MQKWEYRVHDITEKQSWSEIQDYLKKLGEEGWELCTVTPDLYSEISTLYIYKKPLEE